MVAPVLDALRRRLPPLGVLRRRLRAPELPPRRPRFSAIDVHVHLSSEFAGPWRARPARAVLAAMDAAGIDGLVDLDGGHGDHLSAEIARLHAPAPDRIVVFASMDRETLAGDDFGAVEAARLRDSVRRGARGLKIWKSLGLEYRDAAGRLVPIDDPRLSPLWETAADLEVPVLIHVADPPAFFLPAGPENERDEELRRYPHWRYLPVREHPDAPGFPSHDELVGQFEHLAQAQPRTRFIAAHLAACGDDLARLAALLEAAPNVSVDISARINELGRQPEAARTFITRFPDRVLFGTDAGPDELWYRVYVHFLETAARSMNYSIYDPPLQGRWRVDALELPDPVLEAVYAGNARRLIRFGA